MGSGGYVIRGGIEGRERLRILARVMAPTTTALLDRVGVAADARILDAGCGGGDVTVLLAGSAPDGEVEGVDLDEVKLELARAEAAAAGLTNVSFRCADLLADPSADERTDAPTAPPSGEATATAQIPTTPRAAGDGGRFDIVYARFLLTHLVDPAAAAGVLAALVAPGGVLVVEDIDFRGHVCHPPHPAFDRYVELYSAVVRRRGGDPTIGPRLPELLAGTGLVIDGVQVVQPAGVTGEVKVIAAITLEAVADAVLAEGLADLDELHALVDDLTALAADDRTFMTLPRIVQVWARPPAT